MAKGFSSSAWAAVALSGMMAVACSDTTVATVTTPPSEPVGAPAKGEEPATETAPGDTSKSSSSGSTGNGGSTGSSSGSTSGGTKPPVANTCATPWPSPGIFNPDCVYLMGTLEEGAAYLDAIIHPSLPNDVHGGFTMKSRHPHIRPTDGRLVFDDENKLLEFHDDVFVANNWPVPDYPVNPLVNDVALAAGGCSTQWPAWLMGFFPDDGKAFYSCGGTPAWIEGAPATKLPFTLDGLLAVGNARSQLVRKTSSLAVRLGGGSEIAVTGLTGFAGTEKTYARFVGTEFVLALFDSGGTSGALWHIALDGHATLVGAYAMGAGPAPQWYDAVLDAAGALYFFSKNSSDAYYDDQIERISVAAARDVVYQESATKKVKIHASQLVSGY